MCLGQLSLISSAERELINRWLSCVFTGRRPSAVEQVCYVQEAQRSQRDRPMLRVTEYFAKSH